MAGDLWGVDLWGVDSEVAPGEEYMYDRRSLGKRLAQ